MTRYKEMLKGRVMTLKNDSAPHRNFYTVLDVVNRNNSLMAQLKVAGEENYLLTDLNNLKFFKGREKKCIILK